MKLFNEISSVPRTMIANENLFRCAKLRIDDNRKERISNSRRNLQSGWLSLARFGTQRSSANERRNQRGEVVVSSTKSRKQGTPSCTEEENLVILAHEKLGNKVIHRYSVDAHFRLQVMDEDKTLKDTTEMQHSVGPLYLPIHIPQVLQDFFLPTDFPDNVSDDYLRYMLWQFPTNVTGWICSTLVTSSLLKAVGVGAWAGSTAAATAAIKWVAKDGLGALGRLFVGGGFGRLFDDDPKQWRMYADFIGSVGSIFELATPLAPGLFLPLAALGNLTKAVARGLKDPSFRVIQTHFAIAGNMGEVAAKEEVWEVSAELVGIALGVTLLATPGLAASYPKLLLTWASVRSLHLWLRYQSLVSLQFPTINFKRAFILVESHVSGSPIPGIIDCNKMESLLLPWQLSKPYLQLGCSLKDAMGTQVSASELESLLSLYMEEKHILVLHLNPLHGVDVRIIFKEGATSTTILRSMWQAEWLMFSLTSEDCVRDLMSPNLDSLTLSSQMNVLTSSLQELKSHFGKFIHEVEAAGWEMPKIVLKVPKDAPYLANIVPHTTLNILKNKKS